MKVVKSFVGKTLVRYEQQPNRGNFALGYWADDEPLNLTFDDGSVLSIFAGGWHSSGSLYVESGP